MSTTPVASGPPPSALVLQMLGGFQVSQAIYVATKLGVPTILEEEGSHTVAALAERTGADPEALRRLLRTLASLGLFRTEGNQIFTTALGAVLSEKHPQSLYDVAHYWAETHYLPFSDLMVSVRTGKPGATAYLNQPFFDWVEADPGLADLQSRAMAEVTSSLRTGMFDGYELPAGKTIADIGSGDGSVLVELLRRDGDAGRRGIAFDLPGVAPSARRTLGASGLTVQLDVVEGDFFAEVPAADIYVLAYIMHDWDDESCLRILGSLAAAAQPGARLLVVEGIVPPGDEPHLTKAIDLTMLGLLTGKERSEQEYRELLDRGGFTLDRIVATPSPFAIIEATLR